MEGLVRAMASKVDKGEAEGCLVSCCVKDYAGQHQIMTGARTGARVESPFHLYAGMLGKLFHTITKGHPEPHKLLNSILHVAVKEFEETVQDERKRLGEFTVVGTF